QRIGVAAEIAERTYVGGGGQFLSATGQYLGGWHYRPPANGWENSYYFYQPELEAIINRRVDTTAGLVTKRQATLLDHADHSDSVPVRVRHGYGNTIEYRARYLLACDGARSGVRTAMGADIHDIGYEERGIVVDVNMTAPVELPPIITQYCDPE